MVDRPKIRIESFSRLSQVVGQSILNTTTSGPARPSLREAGVAGE